MLFALFAGYCVLEMQRVVLIVLRCIPRRRRIDETQLRDIEDSNRVGRPLSESSRVGIIRRTRDDRERILEMSNRTFSLRGPSRSKTRPLIKHLPGWLVKYSRIAYRVFERSKSVRVPSSKEYYDPRKNEPRKMSAFNGGTLECSRV